MPKRAEVETWLAAYDNPMKDVVRAIRDVMLGADRRIDECIKWQAPTFTFEGNLASFYPKSKQHASLMFHQGAKIPGEHPRLEGSGNTSRVLKLGSVREVKEAKKELEAIVHAWIAWKSGGASTPSGATKTAPAKKKSPSKTAPAKKKSPPKKAPAKKKGPPMKPPAEKKSPPMKPPAEKKSPPMKPPAEKKSPPMKAPARKRA